MCACIQRPPCVKKLWLSAETGSPGTVTDETKVCFAEAYFSENYICDDDETIIQDTINEIFEEALNRCSSSIASITVICQMKRDW